MVENLALKRPEPEDASKKHKRNLKRAFTGAALAATLVFSGCASGVTIYENISHEKTQTGTTLNERRYELPILAYHAVDAKPLSGSSGVAMTVPTNQFQEEMDYLAENGYHTITLSEVYDAVDKNLPLPAKSVAITFDDGYLDQYSVAYPILKSHNFTATFFVITNMVGRNGKYDYISWDQLKEMQNSGMDIESHTVNHPNLTKLKLQSLADQMVKSKEVIKAHLGKDPKIIAYPGNKYDANVETAAQNAGYVAGLTCDKGKLLFKGTSFEWPRIQISGEPIVVFEKQVR
jgi:peptidoglycan/xylan/chitin deacetylase (PgdA/CDA1 family)